ncbi:MAG: hypothetical protein AAF730_20320 [Bacteroidota bacterium]
MALLLVGTMMVGCNASKEAADEGEPEGTTVEVRNRNWRSMEIYVWEQSRRVRLGRIRAGAVKTFTVPGYLTAPGTELRFEMESAGNNPDVFSQAFVVAPGEALILVIPNSR